jgi:hypothetical protein
MKPLLSFVLGLIVGAGLLFALEHGSQFSGYFHAHPSMQANVAGNWHGSVSVAGNNIDISLAVKNDNNILSGTISSSQGDAPCEQLAVDPVGNVSFSVHVQDRTVNFTGKLSPDAQSMAGNLTGDGDVGTGDGDVGTGGWSVARNKS